MVNEVYLSLQGESTFAGLPCIFIRLTGCHLRCSYCDTAYAFRTGRRWSWGELRAEAGRLASPFSEQPGPPGSGRLPLVEFTGGEPLLQHNAVEFMSRFCDDGFTVLVETNGARDLATVDPRVRCITDLKCPSSGEVEANLWSNLDRLKPIDEVKFVVGAWEDYEWMKEIIERHRLSTRCPVLVSWVSPLASSQRDPSLKPVPGGLRPMSRAELAEAIIADSLPVRFQLQAHKFIWPSDARGV